MSHLARTLARRVITRAVLPTLVVGGAVLVFPPPMSNMMPIPTQPSPIVATEQVTYLLDAHDCWSRVTPPDMVGVIPGAAVISTRKGLRYTRNTHLIGEALDLGVKHTPQRHVTEVWGFCR